MDNLVAALDIARQGAEHVHSIKESAAVQARALTRTSQRQAEAILAQAQARALEMDTAAFERLLERHGPYQEKRQEERAAISAVARQAQERELRVKNLKRRYAALQTFMEQETRVALNALELGSFPPGAMAPSRGWKHVGGRFLVESDVPVPEPLSDLEVPGQREEPSP